MQARTTEDREAMMAKERVLIERYSQHGDMAARSELIECLMPLVRHIARRYANRSEPLEDLVQVGCVGLIKAVDRFDVDRGVRLSTFAAPNIAGEIKRHFRDRGWTIRVPRDIQELSGKLHQAVDRLTPKLGRSPTVDELAEATGSTPEDVLDALQGAQSYSAMSLDEPYGDSRTAMDVIGEEDSEFETAEARVLVNDGLRVLEDRERTIVRLRFYEGLTQREIAERIGISQMHVSRLIRRAIEEMRETLEDGDEAVLREVLAG